MINTNFISVDVEADGPCPGLYSMVSFGAVVVEDNLTRTFYGKTAPISDNFNEDALAVINVTRQEHLSYSDPSETMNDFSIWLKSLNLKQRPIFITDNLGFDWQFINYYFHRYTGKNPFGFSGRRINDIYSGYVQNLYASNDWKKFRKTKHTHNPVDDAVGNAEALLYILQRFQNTEIKPF